MSEQAVAELLKLNQSLLDAIGQADWHAYRQLCHPDLTCFEPETRGQIVTGLAFHKFYFDLGAASPPPQNTMASPKVWLLGDAGAVVAYVRLVQRVGADGSPQTGAVEETRVWQRIDGAWRHVHIHRSPLA